MVTTSSAQRRSDQFSALNHDNISCSLCKDPNTQENEVHLLSCPFLMKEEKMKIEMCKVKFNDVFLGISQQVKAVQVFKTIMEIYEKKNE